MTLSTLSAETLAAAAAADTLIPLRLSLHEIRRGPLSTTEARRMREKGRLAFKTILTFDAMSLPAAVAAATVRVPSEKSLAGHLSWKRELLDRQIINQLDWADTCDMTAACHTKGSIERTVILKLMLGMFGYSHPSNKFQD